MNKALPYKPTERPGEVCAPRGSCGIRLRGQSSDQRGSGPGDGLLAVDWGAPIPWDPERATLGRLLAARVGCRPRRLKKIRGTDVRAAPPRSSMIFMGRVESYVAIGPRSCLKATRELTQFI